MTMPDERARAIRWGREDLIKIQEDPLVGDEVKREAAEIFANYPDEGMLESWIDGSELTMKVHTRDALLRARQLFEKIRMADDLQGTPELRRSLLFTLRHFPMPYELVLRPQASERVAIQRRWVA